MSEHTGPIIEAPCAERKATNTLREETKSPAPIEPMRDPVSDPGLFLQDVVACALKRLGISKRCYSSREQHKDVSRARQIIWAIIRQNTFSQFKGVGLSLSQIGVLTGPRDHTSVINGIDHIAALASAYPHIARQADEVARDVRAQNWSLGPVSPWLIDYHKRRPERICRNMGSWKRTTAPSPFHQKLIIARRNGGRCIDIGREYGVAPRVVSRACLKWIDWEPEGYGLIKLGYAGREPIR